MQEKTIPIIMITGFLGSGKTTLMKQVLEQLHGNRKIGIIQNEFAAANVDAQEIHQSASGNYRMMEINNGSIFCVCLLGTFLDSLEEFSLRYQPDLLLIESSGLADPIAIAEIFNQAPDTADKNAPAFYLKTSVAVVDAKNFLNLSKFQRQLRNQIRIADHIVLNKVDMIEDTQPTLLELRDLNPTANIQCTSYCKLDWQALILKPESPLEPLIADSTDSDSFPISSRPQNLQSTVFRSAKPLVLEHLETFVQAIAAESLRAKGSIFCDDLQTYAVQCVLGDVHILLTKECTHKSFFTTISETLSHAKIEDLFLKYCIRDEQQMATPLPLSEKAP